MAKCTICGTRPIGGGKSSGYEDVAYNREQGFCNPCGDEGQMSNSHLNGHESISEDECWFCHPELDETKKEYVERAGTSRAGMVINVPIRADGLNKAIVTATKLGLEIPEGATSATAIKKALKEQGAVLVSSAKSPVVSFAYGDLKLTWESNGRFLGGIFGDRKIRNVAEALRVAA